MQDFVAEKQVELREFNKEFGNTSLGAITVKQAIGGMRGIPGMLYETSKLHPLDGIEYRGYDLFRVREVAPKAVPGGQPIPEGVLWLLLTGEFPTEKEIKKFREDIYQRGSLTTE
jgi:citrate synthase